MSAGFAGATGKKYSFFGHGEWARRVKLGKPGHCFWVFNLEFKLSLAEARRTKRKTELSMCLNVVENLAQRRNDAKKSHYVISNCYLCVLLWLIICLLYTSSSVCTVQVRYPLQLYAIESDTRSYNFPDPYFVIHKPDARLLQPPL